MLILCDVFLLQCFCVYGMHAFVLSQVGLGSIAAEQTIFAMLAPAVVPPLYASTEARAPNTCYWLATLLVALSLVVSLTLPNLERTSVSTRDQEDSCCSCRCKCCEDSDTESNARQLGEFVSGGDIRARGYGQHDSLRRDYTKRLASERRAQSYTDNPNSSLLASRYV
jgi:hypothetical protein